MFKSELSASAYRIKFCLCIIIFAVAPCPHFGRLIAHLDIRSGIEQPERNIHAFDLVDVILVFKHFREQALSLIMFPESLFRSPFVDLKRNHKIRSQFTRKLPHQDYRISAEWTGSRRCIFITRDLTAAGLTDIRVDPAKLIRLPRLPGGHLPAHIVRLVVSQLAVIACQRFHLELRIAVRTFHLLYRTVEGDRAAAARTFIFLYCRHRIPPYLPFVCQMMSNAALYT